MDERALLFTDLVDSTAAVERLGDARAAAVFAEHDRHARALLARHGGREIDRSDGFFLLFADAVGAAAFALAYHAALAALGLRARAGLHVGAVTLHENDAGDVARGAKPLEVEGLAKPLAARVMSLACGGQTLLTATARAAIGANLDPAAAIERHGHYRLKGIAEPVEIFEIGARDRPSLPPPGDTEKAFRVVRAEGSWLPVREVQHNLPRERDAFVGREVDLAAVAGRFDAGTRLLTVLGPGGTGKTRLARRYGRNWLGDWPGGVYFCDLCDAHSLDGILLVVGLALEVPLGKGDPAVQLGHAIATRGRCLVILDNFEQVVAHAEASVGRWLDRAPDAAFLVTSRARLHLAGEGVLPLEPLAVSGEGVELFALRARAQRADFALTPANRPLVERIVALLDGLPLAIELAAARIRVLSPAQLLERLSDRFAVLAGARGAADRQATLRNAIDWSWNLLAPWEQSALAQCAVFDGGFTLDAAEAVLDLSAWPDAPSIVDTVEALVDKTLLRTWTPATQARHELDEPYFGMYLTIHEYAAEKLAAEPGNRCRLAEARHGHHYAALGSDERLRALFRHGGSPRRAALTLELDNLVAACRRAVARSDGATAVATLRATWEAIATRGAFGLVIELGTQVDALADIAPTLHAAALTTLGNANIAAGRLEVARTHLERALALAVAANDSAREVKVLVCLANAERQQGRMDAARGHAERAITLGEAHGVADGGALIELGVVQRQTGAMDDARASYERALAVTRELGDADSQSKAMNSLAIVHAEQGRFDEARSRFEATLALCREIGNRRLEGLALGNLGSLCIEQGRLAPARELCEAALAIHRDTGERAEEGRALANIAGIDQAEGRVNDARDKLLRSLAISQEVGNRPGVGVILTQIGALELDQGRIGQARECYEQALALHRAVGNRRLIGATLAQLGELQLAAGRLDDARVLVAEGETELRAIDERLDLALLLCLRGRVELAAGDAARAGVSLAEAESHAVALRVEPGSGLKKAIDTLAAALAAGAMTTAR